MSDLVTWLRQCAVDGCDRTGKLTRGMCGKHYRYWLDHTPVSDRGVAPRFRRNFWDFVTKSHERGCWTWTEPRSKQGYGCWGRELAHRHSWELANGKIPDGLWVLHHCDNPPCVNPAHLYVGSRVENTRDAVARGRMHSPRRSTCGRGHPKSGDNLVVVQSGGYTSFRCRICDNARKAASARRVRRERGLLRRRLTDTDRQQIVDLRRSGRSHRSIAQETDRALATVQRTLKAAGLWK